MDVVEFVEFPLNTTVVAPVIYREWKKLGPTSSGYVDQPHRVTPQGVRISREAARELGQLLYNYSRFIDEPGRYCRADVLVTPNALMVLEVNMAYIDGWGTALNLSRAAGIKVWPPSFARCFLLDAPAYQPELELLLQELGGKHRICQQHDTCDGPACAYGLRNPAIDNKRHLARFAPYWHGELVKIPTFYTEESGTSWADVPTDVYLKFTDKFGPYAQAARVSVLRGKPGGKARFLRHAYEQGGLIAQARVEALGRGGKPYAAPGAAEEPNPGLQLVVMAAGPHELMGYVQYAFGDIITDDSVHGPLQLG